MIPLAATLSLKSRFWNGPEAQYQWPQSFATSETAEISQAHSNASTARPDALACFAMTILAISDRRCNRLLEADWA